MSRTIKLAIVVAATLLPSCSGDDGAEAPPVTEAATSPSVGREDAPDVCAQLADSRSMTDLAAAVPQLLAGGDDEADQVAGDAAETLHRLADDAEATLGRDLERAGDALDAIIGAEPPRSSDVRRFSRTFAALGEEVQETCEFPLT